MNQIKTYGQIKDKKIEIYNRGLFLENISQFGNCEIELIVKRKSKTRSNNQNRYYFGCVIPIIQNTLKEQHGIDYSATETHDFLKMKFNYQEIHNENAEIERIPITTVNLSTVDFEHFIDRIRRWVLDFFEIDIPPPNTQLQIIL